MSFQESKAWATGKLRETFYADALKDAAERPIRDAARKKIITPADMPWEMSPHGLIKHLVNDKMNARVETVDIYMQIIPGGSRSGKHRQLAEECLYVLEGRGYDIHVDCDVEITDTYHWTPQDTEKRFEWEAGDMIYVPPNTISQHFNADPERPVRLVSAVNRIYKYSGLNDLQQLENAPEYEPNVVLDDESILKYIGAAVRYRTQHRTSGYASCRTGEAFFPVSHSAEPVRPPRRQYLRSPRPHNPRRHQLRLTRRAPLLASALRTMGPATLPCATPDPTLWSTCSRHSTWITSRQIRVRRFEACTSR